jgi:chromosome segregation ATPase
MAMLDIRDNLRDDERRQRDEARLNALQEQVEELRLLLKETTSRQAKAEENHQAMIDTVAQLDSRLDAVRAESQGFNGARQVEVGRLRGVVDALDQRLDTAVQPIATLQARIADLTREMRDKFQELGQDRPRFDELQARIDRLPPQVERGAEIARQAREDVDAVRREIDGVRADWRKVNDAIGIVDQDARRRASDLTVKLDDVNVRIDAVKDELPPLDVQIDRVRHELHQALPNFETLAAADTALKEEIDRLGTLSFDRHVQAMARADEAREMIDERVRVVERLNDTRFSSTMARFAELDEADRSLGHRITLLAVRLEELREQDTAIRIELRRLEELRVRLRLEQAQQEAKTVHARLAELGLARGDNEGSDE